MLPPRPCRVEGCESDEAGCCLPCRTVLQQIREEVKIFQERLDSILESSPQISLSPIKPQNKPQISEIVEIPDSPTKPLETPEVIVNPLERQESRDSSIIRIHQESSNSPPKPRESSESTAESIKSKKLSVSFKNVEESSPSPKNGDRQLKMTVKAAQLSRELPVRLIEQKKLYELHSVEHFQSPSEFSIRLKIEVRLERIISTFSFKNE